MVSDFSPLAVLMHLLSISFLVNLQTETLTQKHMLKKGLVCYGGAELLLVSLPLLPHSLFLFSLSPPLRLVSSLLLSSSPLFLCLALNAATDNLSDLANLK